MAKDYYNVLGVQKNASKDEIKKAFRKLAHEHHPDKKGGDDAKFKEVNEAYQVLSDDEKRARYDQFGSADGPQGFNGGGFGGFDFSGFRTGNGGQGFEFDLNDIFETFMGGGFGGGFVRKGKNIRLQLRVTFEESVFGVVKKIKLPKESSGYNRNPEMDVTIPAGIENGQQLRYRGYGGGVSQGESGDLLISIVVDRHPVWRKEGFHLVREVTIKLSDAILGSEYELETLREKIKVKIPQGVTEGQLLRVKGYGVPRTKHDKGDCILVIHIDIPSKLSKEQKKIIENLREAGL